MAACPRNITQTVPEVRGDKNMNARFTTVSMTLRKMYLCSLVNYSMRWWNFCFIEKDHNKKVMLLLKNVALPFLEKQKMYFCPIQCATLTENNRDLLTEMQALLLTDSSVIPKLSCNPYICHSNAFPWCDMAELKWSDIILVTWQRCSVQEFSRALHVQCSGMILALGQLIKAWNKKKASQCDHTFPISQSGAADPVLALLGSSAEMPLSDCGPASRYLTHTHTRQRNTWLSFAHDGTDQTFSSLTFVLSSLVPKLWEHFDWYLIQWQLQQPPVLKWLMHS